MKHIFVYLLAAMMIFSYIGVHAASQQPDAPSFLPVARIAAAVATAPETIEEEIQMGILLGCADDVNTARFKNSFEKNVHSNVTVHTVDAAGNDDTQQVMFAKMLEEGYSVIVVELSRAQMAEVFIKQAEGRDVSLIFIGEEPEKEVLLQRHNLYYIGFDGSDPVVKLAQELARIWSQDQDSLDYRSDSPDVLAYSAFTKTGFEASGRKKEFDAALKKAGVKTELKLDSETRYYDYELHDEVDDSLYAKTELILCDNSVDAQKIIDYFDDPLEFSTRPRTKLVLSAIDDGARKLVESGKVLLASGPDGNELGTAAARLAQLLITDEVPRTENMGITPEDERYFRLSYAMIKSDLLS